MGLNRGKSSGVVKLDAVAVKKIVRNVVDYGLSVKDMARRYRVSVGFSNSVRSIAMI